MKTFGRNARGGASHRWFPTVACVAFALLSSTSGMAQESDTEAITKDIDAYTKSIDNCDIHLASTVWLTSPDVAFVHPRGHEQGWDEIVRNFYGKTMGETFSKRKLTVAGQPVIKLFTPDMAVVDFNWDFVATFAQNGQQLHTKGRETQVYAKIDGAGWKLLHVHYSGPAETEAGRGF